MHKENKERAWKKGGGEEWGGEGEKREGKGIGGEGSEKKYKVETRSWFYRLELKRVRTKQFCGALVALWLLLKGIITHSWSHGEDSIGNVTSLDLRCGFPLLAAPVGGSPSV